MSWEKKKLSDCCFSITDGDHQPPPKSETGVPFVTIANITNNKFDFSNTMFTTENYYDSLDNKRKAQFGDVLYSVVGSFGIPVLIKKEQKFVFQRHIAILRCNEDILLPEYLYYTMLTRDFYLMADTVAIGAAQRTISLTSLRNLKIEVPPIEAQERIVKRICPYDDLIENNQKQIKLLEEAAQRLYKEWFVDLHFPGYESTPIVDGVPQGWKKEKVGNLLGNVSRTKQIKATEYLAEGRIPIVDQSRDFIAGYTNDNDSLVDVGVPVIVFGDHTRILKYIQFPFAKGADGTQLIVSKENCMPQSLFYLSLVAVDLSNYHYARHYKYLKAEQIIVPNIDIATKFDKIVSTIFLKIQNLRDTNNKLSQARDCLLPKLMSGELEVKK